jgi:ribosomal-protein-serine acetyltransferase
MTIPVDSQVELRQLRHSDATDIYNTIDTQRAYLGQWLPFVAFTKEMADTQKFVESVVDAPEERFEYVFTIRKAGEFAGLIGFKDTDRLNRKSELGYWLAEGFQKQGIITRSVQRLCQFAFDELDMNRIQIKCATGNTHSNNIPKRLGFRLEGIEREGELLTGQVFTDLAIYSRLKNDTQNALK